jgi:glycosyltransferase involved in cell wall biosynthesis
VRAELEFGDRLVVGYTGLHGLAQGLNTLIEAAALLQKAPEISFAFFGDGPEKPALERLVQQRGLSNVRFYDAQPRSRMVAVLSALDVAAVPLRRLDIFRGALPCKMFESMASGLPLVLSIEGEAKDLVEKGNAGICVQPENPEEIADAILRLHRDIGLRKTLGENGRNYVSRNYNRAEIARNFESLLTRIAQPDAAPAASASAVLSDRSALAGSDRKS